MARINYRLLMAGLPEINSLDDLSNQIHLSKGLLYKAWKFNDFFYIRFFIPKKNGSKREINSPSTKLKAIQSWILRNILNQVIISEHAKAYVRGINLTHNVIPHSKNRYFLFVDLKDFFPSIKYNKIFTIFKSLGYSVHVSHILTSLCTYKNSLPQGGVASPTLSNIVCIKLDRRLSGLAGRKNITYTRYADDLIFSGMNSNIFMTLLKKIKIILMEENFVINEEKTRIIGPALSRTITGLTISENGFGISKKKKRILRASIYNLMNSKKDDLELKSFVEGWFSFIKSVDIKGYKQLSEYRDKLEASSQEDIPF